jgi:hypothetical protein
MTRAMSRVQRGSEKSGTEGAPAMNHGRYIGTWGEEHSSWSRHETGIQIHTRGDHHQKV